MGMDAKFIFATTFPEHNIWNETRELGYLDSEVLWMYSFLRIVSLHQLLILWLSWKILLRKSLFILEVEPV